MVDYAEILANWDTLPALRITYSQDERGWAKRLDMAHAAIANVPFSGGLMLYDIVRLDTHAPLVRVQPNVPMSAGVPSVAEVCQRYYAQQVSVAYLEPGEVDDHPRVTVAYTALRRVCEAAGCATEAGPYPGMAMVNAPAGIDVVALLGPLGIDPANIVVYDDEVDE